MKERIRHLIVALVFLTGLVSTLAHAGVIEETMFGKDFLFQRDYPAALAQFSKVSEEFPDSPAGYFGTMATYQLMMFENLDFRFKDEFYAADKKFERVAARMVQKKAEPWNYFVAGSGFGMRGFFYMREGRWFRALGSATKAMRYLRQALFIDPKFVDAKLGDGMYNYWRSAITKDLHFLPFFGDHRAAGIADVEFVIQNGTYARDMAEINLGYILTNEKDYAGARKIISDYLVKYPKNILIRQLSARNYFWDKKYEPAIAEYKKVLELDPNLTKTLYYIGWVYANRPGLDSKSKAFEYFERFLATNPEKEWQKQAELVMKRLNSGGNNIK